MTDVINTSGAAPSPDTEPQIQLIEERVLLMLQKIAIAFSKDPFNNLQAPDGRDLSEFNGGDLTPIFDVRIRGQEPQFYLTIKIASVEGKEEVKEGLARFLISKPIEIHDKYEHLFGKSGQGKAYLGKEGVLQKVCRRGLALISSSSLGDPTISAPLEIADELKYSSFRDLVKSVSAAAQFIGVGRSQSIGR